VTCCPDEDDVDSTLTKAVYSISLSCNKGRHMKKLCSYRGLDIRYNAVRFGASEITVQCCFSQVRGNSKSIHKILSSEPVEADVLDADSSVIMVSVGDFITLECDKVYKVREINTDGTVWCVSPANPINELILILLAEANEGLNRQCR
jgi:hypothetical protein